MFLFSATSSGSHLPQSDSQCPCHGLHNRPLAAFLAIFPNWLPFTLEEPLCCSSSLYLPRILGMLCPLPRQPFPHRHWSYCLMSANLLLKWHHLREAFLGHYIQDVIALTTSPFLCFIFFISILLPDCLLYIYGFSYLLSVSSRMQIPIGQKYHPFLLSQDLPIAPAMVPST